MQKLDNWYEHEVNVDHHEEDEHDGHEGHEDEHSHEEDHWTENGQELGREAEKKKHHENAVSQEKQSVRVDHPKPQPLAEEVPVTRGDIAMETADDFDGLAVDEIIPEKKIAKASAKKTAKHQLEDHEIDKNMDFDYMDELQMP